MPLDIRMNGVLMIEQFPILDGFAMSEATLQALVVSDNHRAFLIINTPLGYYIKHHNSNFPYPVIIDDEIPFLEQKLVYRQMGGLN